MVVPVPETDITGRGPCILGKENLGAVHELGFSYEDFERHLKCPKGNVRWQLLDGSRTQSKGYR